MLIKVRWEAINEENTAMALSKIKGELYKAEVYEDGDSTKYLLAHSRYLLFKKENL